MPPLRFAILLLVFFAAPLSDRVSLVPQTSAAQAEDAPVPNLPSDEDGFGPESENLADDAALFSGVEYEAPVVETASGSRFQIDGFLTQELAYRLKRNDPAWRKIRTVVNLEADTRIASDWFGKFVLNGFYDFAYALFGRDNFH